MLMGNPSPEPETTDSESALFYKFKPCDENAISMVKEGKIWFSRLTSLNDPFEGDFTVTDDDIKKFVENKLIKEGVDPSQAASLCTLDYTCSMLAKYRENVRSKYYIFSAAKGKWSDILMWSHYSVNHTGVCVGIEIPDRQEYFTDKSEKRLVVNNSNGKQSIIHPITYTDSPMVIPIARDPEQARLCRSKSPQWEYEMEHRLIIHDEDIRSKGYLMSVNPQAIKRVIFGAKTELADIDKFIKSVGRDDIMYRRAVIRHGMFKLNSAQA
jgi:hypothetical protein